MSCRRAVETQTLRCQRFDFCKGLEIVGVESVDARDTVKLHRSDNLQIEYVASVTGRRRSKSLTSSIAVTGTGSTRRKPSISEIAVKASAEERGLRTPRIGDDGVKFAEDLRSYVKCCPRCFALSGFKQRAASYMLRRFGVERIDQNICVNNSRLNGHRYRCRAGGGEPMTPRCQTGKEFARVGCRALGAWPFPESKRKAASFTRCSVSVPAMLANSVSCASCSGVKFTSMPPDYEITGSGAITL
jgi:hypothetical protein